MSLSRPAEGRIRQLVCSYIRGELTAGEVRQQVREDPELAGLVSGCLGLSTFPHELLEQAGMDPFVSELDFDPPLAMTRSGMKRNLDLAREGALAPAAVADWAADWFSWQIAARPDDDVILELAGELMLGEEAVEQVLHDPARLELYRWHLANTPATLGPVVAFGLAVLDARAELEEAIALELGEKARGTGPEGALRKLLGDHLNAMPGLSGDLAEAIRMLGGKSASRDGIRRFLEEIARTADPLSAAETA